MRIAPGVRVSHAQYGAGTISATDEQYTVIDFDDHGTKRFVTRMVTLESTSVPAPSKAPAKKRASRKKKDADAE
jgi:hypothetical protein